MGVTRANATRPAATLRKEEPVADTAVAPRPTSAATFGVGN